MKETMAKTIVALKRYTLIDKKQSMKNAFNMIHIKDR